MAIILRAREEFRIAIADPLFSAGIALYWGEGDRGPCNPLRLSNTDGRMIGTYSLFLRTFMQVPMEKIRIGLVLYPDLSDSQCRAFWASVAGVPTGNFMKTQYIDGKHPTKRLPYGICMVVVNSRAAKLKMLTWIDIFAKRYTIVPCAGIV